MDDEGEGIEDEEEGCSVPKIPPSGSSADSPVVNSGS